MLSVVYFWWLTFHFSGCRLFCQRFPILTYVELFVGFVVVLHLEISAETLGSNYKSLRNDLAIKVLGRGWSDLTLQEKEMLKMVYKENISEAPVIQ